jgi:signal transduction histidine kinase
VDSFEWLDAEVLLAMAGLSTALVAGEWIRARREYIVSTVERARLAELGREEEARRRVDEERLRIAREMHDVLAHSLASINVQAGVTLHVLHKHPAQAEDALKSIKAASAEALQELRTTVGSLRGVESNSDRLDRLDALIEPARNAGLRVRVHTLGRRYKLPAHLDLAAYRILQESITNSIRYAGPAQLTITLDYEPDHLRIRVEDDGVGLQQTAPSDGTGKGIAGMRERAAAVGGTVEAGPLPDRGFAVRAVIPVRETAA